jgi:hypothetical protein
VTVPLPRLLPYLLVRPDPLLPVPRLTCFSRAAAGILSHGSSSGEYALLIGNQRLSGQFFRVPMQSQLLRVKMFALIVSKILFSYSVQGI